MKDKTKLSTEDQALFREAMREVTPLPHNLKRHHQKVSTEKQSTPPSAKVTIKPKEKPLVTVELSDHYQEIVSVDQKISFYQAGISQKNMKLLQQGSYPIADTLDLHGASIEAARSRLIQTILSNYHKGSRCILVIHGKSHQSQQHPILKNHINHWLKQIPVVLAFCSAVPRDGGTGAVYVLLRKRRTF